MWHLFKKKKLNLDSVDGRTYGALSKDRTHNSGVIDLWDLLANHHTTTRRPRVFVVISSTLLTLVYRSEVANRICGY